MKIQMLIFMSAMALSSGFSQTLLPASLRDNLIGEWLFENNGNDRSVNSNHLVINNTASFEIDRYGNTNSALKFIASNTQANSIFNINLSGNAERTISFWAKFGNQGTYWNGGYNQPGGYTQTFVQWGNYSQSRAMSSWSQASGGHLWFQAHWLDIDNKTPNNLPLFNEWRMVTFVYKDSLSSAQEYLDTNIQNNSNLTLNSYGNEPTLATVATPLSIIGSAGDFIDDVRIFDRALTPTEIGQLYLAVPEPSALSLLAVGLGGLAILRRRRPVRKVARSITLLSFVFFTNLCQAQLGFDNGTTWVDVADPGKGNVSYSFKISKYETTVTQYVSFLNSVAQTSDPHGLFHGFNWRYAEPINRSGSIGNYSYSVADGFQNRAITAMNWLDAARYVNWLHNGGTSSSDTETGVYSLNGVTSLTVGTTISRNTTAKFFIPTAEEWQKAGFYDPTKNGGSGGWWASANQSATTPGDPAVMNINQAYLDPIRGYVTDVGFFTEQDSFYGTYDQSGNVWEWTEGATLSGTVGGLNGGGWDYFDGTYGSVMVGGNKAADFRKDSTGFRIGAIPEPSALSLLVIGGIVSLVGKRRSK